VITPAEILAEQARAALWREQAQRRAAFQSALWASLAAPPASYARVRANWDPLVAWLAEREMPPVEPDEDPYVDPLGISDTVNVGT
jgi:hypothetical protein